MKNLFEVLKEKEIAIARLRREIAALRLAVPLLHDEGDFTDDSEESAGQEETNVIPISESEALLARRRSHRLEDEGKGSKEANERSVLLQFRQIALGASRTFLKRVLDSRLLEREPQRKTIRNLFEWLGPTKAA